MEIRWTNALLVIVVFVTKTLCAADDSLQSLEPAKEDTNRGKDRPTLPEFYDHAEYKVLGSQENINKETSSTELPEVLPTPIPLKQSNAETQILDDDDKPSVPKKGVPAKKPSVVPKKEVHFHPSVVGKKGADPESSTPSVSPRKGVKMSQGSSVPDVLLVSSENMNNSNDSSAFEDDMNSKINSIEEESRNKTDSKKQPKESLNNIPIPQIVQKEKSNQTQELVKKTSSSPLPDPDSTSSPTVSKSKSASEIVRLKPTTADDAGAISSQVSYAPIFVIVALVALVVVVVAVGYHRLKDIWARRHYDYVDFLIDGMYE